MNVEVTVGPVVRAYSKLFGFTNVHTIRQTVTAPDKKSELIYHYSPSLRAMLYYRYSEPDYVERCQAEKVTSGPRSGKRE